MFGMIAFGVILSGINIQFKSATYLGGISYSLYIIHWPFGILIESITKRIIQLHEYPIGKIAMLLFYTIMAVLFAHFFNKYIEKPFLNYSKKIKNLQNYS